MFLQAFSIIHDAAGYDLVNADSIFRRMINCFMKGHVQKLTNELCQSKKETARKKRKLAN